MKTHRQSDVTLNDGATMPQLGLGVWRTPAGDAASVVSEAVRAGYRAVDTASAYNNEEGVGEALAGHDIFLTTKLWNADQGFDETLRAFDASAKRLRREAVDLYLIHWPAPKKGLFVKTWKALVRLREDGRAKSIGVSNFNEEHLKRIIDETGVTPAVNQIELHPRFQQRELRAVHERLGIHTESWSPKFHSRRDRRQARHIACPGDRSLAPRLRPDRHTQDGEPRTAAGEHRRLRL